MRKHIKKQLIEFGKNRLSLQDAFYMGIYYGYAQSKDFRFVNLKTARHHIHAKCSHDNFVSFGFRLYSDNILLNKENPYLLPQPKIKWHLYYQKIKGTWTSIYAEYDIDKSRFRDLKRLSDQKKEKEWYIIQKKEELDNIRTIEQGRKFTGRLRQLILERDNYRCVLCGADSNSCKLEVDHILPWADGGKTMYENGRTVCPDCNKGLHHLKIYNNKKKDLMEAITNENRATN
jgi:hypothetical protein